MGFDSLGDHFDLVLLFEDEFLAFFLLYWSKGSLKGLLEFADLLVAFNQDLLLFLDSGSDFLALGFTLGSEDLSLLLSLNWGELVVLELIQSLFLVLDTVNAQVAGILVLLGFCALEHVNLLSEVDFLDFRESVAIDHLEFLGVVSRGISSHFLASLLTCASEGLAASEGWVSGLILDALNLSVLRSELDASLSSIELLGS